MNILSLHIITTRDGPVHAERSTDDADSNKTLDTRLPASRAPTIHLDLVPRPLSLNHPSIVSGSLSTSRSQSLCGTV